ncbi:MAG: hypothetical protein QGH83_04975 [Candidatus Pacebacteria bacterium]|nr:hypothetical protein [Candidatus Paceibacterota bacterium]
MSTQKYIDAERGWIDSLLNKTPIVEGVTVPVEPVIDIDPDIEKEIAQLQEAKFSEKIKEIKLVKEPQSVEISDELGGFFTAITKAKTDLTEKIEKEKVKIAGLEELFKELSAEKKKKKKVEKKKVLLLEPEEEVIETVYVEPIEKEEETLETVEEKQENKFIKAVEKQLSKTKYQNELDKNKLKTLDKIDSLDKMKEEFVKFKDTVSHQLSTLGGGGSVNILDNDDVDLSSKANGKVLAYNSTSGKMEFVSQSSGGADLDAVDEHIIPDGDGTRDLGTSLKRWRDIYLSSDSIDLAGATISSDGTGAIAIAATGATLPEGSKTTAGNQLAVRGTGTSSSNSAVIKVPFFSAAGGLSTKNAEFEFNATLDNNKPFLDQQTFTLANGSGLSSDDTITVFQF